MLGLNAVERHRRGPLSGAGAIQNEGGVRIGPISNVGPGRSEPVRTPWRASSDADGTADPKGVRSLCATSLSSLA